MLVVKDNGDFATDQTYQTIQSAVDAASPGDIIEIEPHSQTTGYQEYINITTPNIKLIGAEGKSKSFHVKYAKLKGGADKKSLLESFEKMSKDNGFMMPFSDKLLKEQDCPKVILDGSTNSIGKKLILVDAPDVHIENLFFRHGSIEIGTAAHNSVIRNNCILGDVPLGIRTVPFEALNGANGLLIEGNFFQGGASKTIELTHQSSNHVIRKNVILMTHDSVLVRSLVTNVLIEENVFMGCNDYCIDYSASNGVIKNNVIMNAGYGIRYGVQGGGDNPTITGNKMMFIRRGHIFVICSSSCTGGEISRNLVFGSPTDHRAIYLQGTRNFQVFENEVYFTTGPGMLVQFGSNSTIRNNLLSHCGTGGSTRSALVISSDDMVVEENEVYYSGIQGIYQNQGRNNLYRKNYVIGSGRDGIQIEGGSFNSFATVIEENLLVGNLGHGIGIRTSNQVTLTNNVLIDNRIDLCVRGTILAAGVVNVINDSTAISNGGLNYACDI